MMKNILIHIEKIKTVYFDMDSSDVVSSNVTLSLMLQPMFYYVMQHAESCHETSAIVV